MIFDIQRASTWKRIAAWMFDGILTAVLAVGIGFLLSAVLGYDGCSERLDAIYLGYETEYGVEFEITQEAYQAMTEAQRERYDAAYQALIADEEAVYVYNLLVNLTLVITSLGILFAILIWEFAIPMMLGNGQTLGKKIFGLCLIRNDGVKLSGLQLFARTVLGKYAIETMIPVYIFMMLFWGTADLWLMLLGAALVIAQPVCIAVTRNRCAIHDLLAGTVITDLSSQMIFPSTEDLIAYQKRVAAEQAARAKY